ncbi:MAG: energy transducer TonB [Novosphingobium sp.]
MTYASSIDTKGRVGTFAAVAAVQLVVGYALIAGLAARFMPKVPDKRTEATNFRLPPPPPPPEQPARADPKPLTRTPPVHDTHQILPMDPPTFTTVSDPVFEGGTLGGTGHDIGEVRIPQPDPPPLPSLVHGAKPRGNPGLWVTADDYPSADLRQEHSGVTRFRLEVGTDGRVRDCTVTASSGHPGLDQAACAKLTARGRFDPAIDSTGARLPGSYASSVRWQIPE